MIQGGSNSAAGVRDGDILAGKYRVERVLGIGGMGVVVAAHHIQLDEKVAIKFLLPHMLADAEAVGRFAREARAAVKIKSEHVARVFDVGTLETGAPYMVMEFLEGGDLSHWLQQRGALGFEQAVEFVLQASVAVAEAHALGIVHRDLKPANLFCIRRADGQLSIKVLDFGISKVTTAGVSTPEMSMTTTSAMMGSPLYMSPEQLMSAKSVDARTDIWALGVILYELLAKQTPFQGEAMTAVCMNISMQPPAPLSTFRPDAPPGLEGVILRCLAKDRERRYRNVAELALALLPFAPTRAKASVERISGIIQSAGLSATALSVPPSPDPASSQPPVGTMAPFGLTTPGPSRGKVAAVVLGGVAVLAVAAGVMVAMRQSTGAPGAGSGAPPVAAAQLLPVVATAQAVLPPAPVAVEPPPAPAAATAVTAASTVVKQGPAKPKAAARPAVAVPTTPTAAAAVAAPTPPPTASKPGPSNPSNADPLSALRPK